MITIIPSLASADQINLEKQIISLGKIDKLHLDIEDGNFVPNITFGMKTVKAVAAYAKQQLDAHLMVNEPDDYIDELLSVGVKKIAVHIEALQYPAVCLSKIRNAGGLAGLAFNLRAPVEYAKVYCDYIDYVLIMTSEPDGFGQRFNEQTLWKIAEARRLMPKRISIIADGGVTEESLPRVIDAGADTVVIGRYLWCAENPKQQYQKLMEVIDGIN